MTRMTQRVLNQSGEVEWYTPPKYIEAAATVMGGIDLDPASSDVAAQYIPAATYFTAEQNGLEQRWFGRVFLNPPYAMPYVRLFIDKLTQSWINADIQQAILLVNDATDTHWFHSLRPYHPWLCFTLGRIRFLAPFMGRLEERPTPMVGQVFCYFGPRSRTFQKVFGEFGWVMRG